MLKSRPAIGLGAAFRRVVAGDGRLRKRGFDGQSATAHSSHSGEFLAHVWRFGDPGHADGDEFYGRDFGAV